MIARNLKKGFFKKLSIYFIAIFALFNFIVPLQASSTQCAQRVIAQNIKSAVLAYKATQYCVGVRLPYSRAQVSDRIDSLRCSSQASNILDELLDDYDGQYRAIMSGTGKQVVCSEAAKLGANFN